MKPSTVVLATESFFFVPQYWEINQLQKKINRTLCWLRNKAFCASINMQKTHLMRLKNLSQIFVFSYYRLCRLTIPYKVKDIEDTPQHIWKLPGNYPVFNAVMVIYHYVERIWRTIITPNFLYNIYDHKKHYPGEPVNIHMHLLINIIQRKIWAITIKKG